MKPILTRNIIILTNSEPGYIMCQFLVSFTILIIILDEQQGNGQVILCISWPRPIIKYGQWLGLTRRDWVLQESHWAKYNDRLACLCITLGIEIMPKSWIEVILDPTPFRLLVPVASKDTHQSANIRVGLGRSAVIGGELQPRWELPRDTSQWLRNIVTSNHSQFVNSD